MESRRDFLRQASGAVFAAGMSRLMAPLAFAAQQEVKFPGEEGMVLRSFRFVDLESPVSYFNSWLTPVPHFFVRNHMHEPIQFDADEWQLTISGEVERPLTLRFADLRKLQIHSVVNTLECAGNGRTLYRPQVPGIQWGKGAVGTARFSGPRLADVLQRAGVKASGKHLMFRGLDEVPGKVPPFIRSIPIEKALDGDTLIATHMNELPLTKHHGFPARLLVPGWVGSASCKWLTELKVLQAPFEGNFMNPGYRMPNHPVNPGEVVKLEDTHTVTALTVKSVIARPADGASVKPGRIMVQGAAWAGDAGITKVEISTDDGATWNSAKLGSERARYAWRLWTYDWKAARSGNYSIMSRATDTQGRTQPASATWNPGGYLNNAVDRVKVHVS
ncbi:MAG TPA: sulfite oxidase [Candidatus Aquilonibacter sp.]|nr:sulfite oxidase [Candidatus Aquilonibacter sp.]